MPAATTIEMLLRHERFARSVARDLVRDGGEVDDLVQEAWIAALAAPPRRSEAALAWIERTVRNIASKWRRSGSRRSARETAVARGERVDAADRLLERLELERRVTEAVLALGEPYRSAIVLRFYEELGPSEIAERLGVPLETVRSRLRRAQAELRRALADDPRTARERWLSALVGIGAVRAPRMAVRASIAVSPGTLGVMLMNLKWALVVALGLAGAAAWLASSRSDQEVLSIAHDSSSSANSPVSRSNPAASAEPVAALAPTDAALVAAAVDGGRAPIAVAPNAAGEPESGRLVLRTVDAITRVPIDEFELRLASESRFASLSVRSGVAYRASVGNYTASISAPGYDRTTLTSVRIESGQTTQRNDIALERGSGRISASLAGLDASSERKFEVELIGDGRGRCEVCRDEPGAAATAATDFTGLAEAWSTRSARRDDSAPSNNVLQSFTRSYARVSATEVLNRASERCGHCGYARHASSAELGASRAFTFANLAAGPYLARLLEDGRLVGEPRRVDLPAGGVRAIVFDLSATRTIDFALLDRGGNPLTGELAAAAGAKGVSLELSRDGECFSKLWFDARPTEVQGDDGAQPVRALREVEWLSTLEFYNRDLTLERAVRGTALDRWSRATNLGAPQEPLIDRARTADDALEPALAAPTFDAVSSSAQLRDGGTAHATALPTAAFTVRATCGDWTGAVQVPSAWSDSRIELVLLPTEQVGTPDSGEPIESAAERH